jgi:hypothetical protein
MSRLGLPLNEIGQTRVEKGVCCPVKANICGLGGAEILILETIAILLAFYFLVFHNL